MDIELISLIICIVLPIIYYLIYLVVQRKKKKKKLLYGLIVAIIIFIILFIIRLLVLLYLPNNKKDEGDNITTTSEVITESTTTTENTTKSTTKQTTTQEKKNYGNVLNPTGGEVVGTTSKGYTVKNINGIYYVDGYLIANKTYKLPTDFNPGLHSTVKKAADEMFAAAKAEKGFGLYIGSGFRSYSSQQSIYNNYVKRDGKAKADTYSARAGHSEHQSGLAFDVCAPNKPCITSGFNTTEEAKWLADNAHKYGFILRYVDGKTNETGYMYESWHFRYVGKELATKLYNNGDWITMEAYFGLTSSYDNNPIGS